MIKNSIEEDIKNAEHFIKSIKTDKEYKEENGWHGYYNKEIVELARILEHILSDYKRVLKENEEIRIKNNAIKRESEAYAEHMIRLDNELNLEKEKSKYEWIRQNCLSQELVNKLYIPIQKVKDKIEELQKEYNKLDKQVDEYIKSVEKIDVSTYYENKERISIMQALSYFIDTLQELIEEREEK